MFVLTIDQRGSRRHGDKVPQLLEVLAGLKTILPFERSVGDEVQAALDDPHEVVEAVARLLREQEWYVGIGVGHADSPLPSSSRAASGDAFVAAREAVDAAKKTGDRVPLSVVTPTVAAVEWAAAAESVLVLMGDVVRRRSAAEWRVLDALDESPEAAQKNIAATLGISPQAVSKAIARSGRAEEQGGRKAAALLLQHAQLALNVTTNG
ncbi:helix-turn-helix domain-containing protein [Arthrobacter sp. H35-D1]|uniref:MarR family transcriptional regulator n=1 Tax=Arthrobacter sp. H35-D1 TaxID=3046202 RepID=UPI0024B9C552|nr:helix-turn-helix domain-containing protein [Arthrobacter sp. H35-D1]MDJ0313672.1 helix-turn-helix domain-containing protein [Arthrobacter sp. H35-D1]